MMGKLIAVIIVVITLVAGGALYYLQVYAYYDTVPVTGATDVQMIGQETNAPEPVPHSAFQAIDSESSPIRYRACFATPLTPDAARARYVVAPDIEPRNAPDWFDCFDAAAISDALNAGTAVTFQGAKNIAYGVDRIVAITDDGRGFVWHELNDCGEKAYDGTMVGEECPPRPNTN